MPPFIASSAIVSIKTIEEIRKIIRIVRVEGKTIGLVPTMGALHQGHASLIEASVRENDFTVASVFVNPTQFNNSADLDKYPRTLEADIELLKDRGCDLVFTPDESELYGSSRELGFTLGALNQVMEGQFRPGHFNGVALVVSKLFNIVLPNRAYFGQKDLQQFAVINLLNEELKFGIELRRMPIIREPSGLAMSSRNGRLSEEGKQKALVLKAVLDESSELLSNGMSIKEVEEKGLQKISNAGLQPEYLKVVAAETLQPVSSLVSKQQLAICLAAYVDEVRLIDNTLLTLP